MRADAALAPSPFARPAPHGPQLAWSSQTTALLVLLVLMPIFLQSFSYLVDVRPVWLVAKMTPILLLPLHLVGLLALRLPYVWLYLSILLYTLLVAPVLSMLQLENDFPEAMGATVKAWTFAFYFGAAAALTLLRTTEATLTRAMLLLALVNFGVLWLLWTVLPIEAYKVDGVGTAMLFIDNERGPRIMMPLAFGMIGLFWLARRFDQRPAVWPLLLIAIGLALMLTIYKQRFAITAVTLLLLLGLTARWRHRAPLVFWALAAGAAGLGAMLLLALAAGGGTEGLGSSMSVRDSLGGSLSVRETSARLLIEFLSPEPARWLFGIGGTTEYGEVTLQHIMRYPSFFLSDLGWLGVLGEYGVVGTVLVILAYAVGFRETQRAVRDRPTPFRHALRDFVCYLLLVSPIYSTVYAPGQIATVTAMAVFLRRLGQDAPPPRRGAVALP